MTPPTYQTVIEPRAAGEVRAICRHIARSSPQGSASVLAQLMDAVASLDQLPHRYKIHESRKDGALTVRSMPVPPYLIYYRVDDARLTVRVLSVRHGARRQPKRIR